jgi:hypothetical protein
MHAGLPNAPHAVQSHQSEPSADRVKLERFMRHAVTRRTVDGCP